MEKVSHAKKILVFGMLCLALLALVLCMAAPAYAETEQTPEEQAENATGSKALAAGLAIGIAAAGGAVAMGLATAKAAESISRQPEAEGKIRTTMMLGLVFIETAIIYALLAVILIIFVL